MDTASLFRGIAVVIDDEIGKDDANINNLIKQIKDKNMPYLTYRELPDDSIIDNFEGISFLLLDWKLQPVTLDEFVTEGVALPDTIRQFSIDENIAFLKKLREHCFIPVFIFTNENKENIIQALKDNNLYREGKPNYIFVERKDDLTGHTKLFKKIDDWIRKTPSIYVLAAWEKAYRSSKTKLFHDFYNLSPSWPKILWDTFRDDEVNMSRELGDIITRNLYTRMVPFSFDSEVFDSYSDESVKQDELRSVLEGERYITELDPDEISTGDVFREEYTDAGKKKRRYFLNIRAQCDLVRSSNPELYCLRGRIIDEGKINQDDGLHFREGEFIEKINHAIVPCIDNGKIIEFLFRDLKPKKWKNIKDKRIGRLLPPYITRIQQRYALYLQRQGLPRIPEIAVLDDQGNRG